MPDATPTPGRRRRVKIARKLSGDRPQTTRAPADPRRAWRKGGCACGVRTGISGPRGRIRPDDAVSAVQDDRIGAALRRADAGDRTTPLTTASHMSSLRL